MKTNRGFAPILGIIIAVIVLGGGYYVYQLAGGDVRVNLPPLERGDSDEGGFTTSPKPSTPTEPVACTMEAKICPDGSAVGRTGPKCEFAACPASQSNLPTGWELYKNSSLGFEIAYPKNVLTLTSEGSLARKLSKAHYYSEKDGSDLGLEIGISFAFTKDPTDCKRIKDIKLPSETFKFTNISGYVGEMGAEGHGRFTYCVERDGVNIFTINRSYLGPYSYDVMNDPLYLSLEEQSKLAGEVLNTFRFLP